jgi:hypothetical protein
MPPTCFGHSCTYILKYKKYLYVGGYEYLGGYNFMLLHVDGTSCQYDTYQVK